MRSHGQGEFSGGYAWATEIWQWTKAFAVQLNGSQMVALSRVQKQISAMMGVVISEATLLKFVLRLYQGLAAWKAGAIEKILQAPSVHVDETSCRVEGSCHTPQVVARQYQEQCKESAHKKRAH